MPMAQACRLPGVLSRLGLIDRIILTPEGVPPAQHRALVRAMIRRGQRIFMLSYHSPSMVPGNTPYVRTQRDLRTFMDRVEAFCDHFFGELGGTTSDPLAVRDMLRTQAGLAHDEQTGPRQDGTSSGASMFFQRLGGLWSRNRRLTVPSSGANCHARPPRRRLLPDRRNGARRV